MASTITRRPLPALVSLLALLALTAIVWWRVINRDTDSDAGATKKTTPTTCTTRPVPTPTTTLAPPRTVKVRVLNSTSRALIASKAQAALHSAGFATPTPAGNDSVSLSTTTVAHISYGKAGVDGARLLHYYFPGSTLVPRKKTHSALVTVTLGSAYKQVASQAQVRKAMAAKRVAVGPANSTTTGAAPSPTSSASPTPAC